MYLHGHHNTCLAAALTAVGIPLAEKPFVRVVGDGIRGERFVWFIDPQSPDGKFQTRELIAAWNDDGGHLANPEHPFAYIKCVLLNRERLARIFHHSRGRGAGIVDFPKADAGNAVGLSRHSV